MEQNLNENKESFKEKYLRRAKKRKIKRIIIVCVLAVGLVLAGFLIDAVREMFNLSNRDAVSIRLMGGESLDEVVNLLEDAGVIKYKTAFCAVAKAKGLDEGFGAGTYSIEPGVKYTYLLRMLISDMREITVTFSEGLTKKQIFQKLAQTGFVDEEELYDAEERGFDYEFLEGIERENPLEGYLFCETYNFSNYQSADEMLSVMLNQFDKEFTDEYKKRAEELGMSVDEVVILASVIQAETAGEENMKNVSGVFHKRLENGEKLQSCATIQYLLEEKKFILSAEDLKIDSPYNTYMYAGLPKGPVCSPSREAIYAALYPADTPYYYFQSDRDGNMYFSKTFEEHEQIRKKIQEE